MLNKNVEAFVVYIALPISEMSIQPAQKAQITLMVIKQVTILTKDLNFVDMFSKKLAVELLERFDINNHLIDLELNK